ncbi:MAG: aldose 1-epimerase family protein, partial [Actinomycetota bacterium]|nr:aldose 1-epimerase family protein [Actinomycetota bacterium]
PGLRRADQGVCRRSDLEQLAAGGEILVALDRGGHRTLHLRFGHRPARRLVLQLSDQGRVGGDDQPQPGPASG